MARDLTVVVLSGKGGAGKTLVSVNLAVTAGASAYIDCDVEEPNGFLYLTPEAVTKKTVFTTVPVVDAARCDGCGLCARSCAFHALAVIDREILVFGDVCHSCGLCTALCPRQALTERDREIGSVYEGKHGEMTCLSGEMHVGESSGMPIVRTLLGQKRSGLVFIDSPPGSGCLVQETLRKADACLLVAEPSLFGAHDLALVHELAKKMGKPCMMVLNKTMEGANPSEQYAKEHGLRIIGRIPYEKRLACLSGDGLLVAENPTYRRIFLDMLEQLPKEVCNA